MQWRFRQRTTDVVWRVRAGEAAWAYLYLLIEFQSRPDRRMALRVMGYVALLWQDLLRRDATLRRRRRLPPVLPVVIYNGLKPWRSATDVAELLPQATSGLDAYLPRMKYLLLDQNRFDESQLRPMRNLMAAVMRLDRRSEPSAILEAIAEQGRQEGRLVGLQEGRQEGRQEGEALLLQRLLVKRFGPLPAAIVERIASAPPGQLEIWGERTLDVTSLDEVFAD